MAIPRFVARPRGGLRMEGMDPSCPNGSFVEELQSFSSDCSAGLFATVGSGVFVLGQLAADDVGGLCCGTGPCVDFHDHVSVAGVFRCSYRERCQDCFAGN